MIVATHGLIASQITQFVGLLDAYPSAAAAYSLRKLRSAYTGSAIRVRRTNLDELDIGFTSTGALDTTALLAFTGTGALNNGFVTTWYDQSGNARNATQATALNQPKIVNAGVLVTENSKPSIEFDGINDSLSFSGTLINSASAHTNFVLYRLRNGAATDNVIMTLKNNSSDLLYFMGGNSLPAYQDFVIGAASGFTPFNYSGITINQFKLLTDFYNGSGASTNTNFSRYANNVLATFLGIVTFGGANTANNNIGNWGTAIPTPINVSELIIYSSNQSANINGINTNIIDNYGL